jgi:hypothetical protein
MIKLRLLYSQGNIILNGRRDEMDSEIVKIKIHEGPPEFEFQLASVWSVVQLT